MHFLDVSFVQWLLGKTHFFVFRRLFGEVGSSFSTDCRGCCKGKIRSAMVYAFAGGFGALDTDRGSMQNRG